MDSKSSEKRFALIIDADNVSAKYIKPITDELSKYGTITYKRIYGDWTSTLHAKWKDALLENSITPIQQFSYTTGKNATDSAMIIDAMDIMYTGSVEGFCIVSSDSDFTRLASRIRESGLTVIGMGEKKTPVPFRKACDIFTTLELLVGEGGKASRRGHRGQAASNAGQGSGPSIEQVERAVADIVTDNQNNGKATGLGEVGSRLLKRYPDFDVRSYGTNQLTKLLGEFSSVQITKDGNSVMVELTESSAAPAGDRASDDGQTGTAVSSGSENQPE
ncbi:MAG: NYN domain-containing protein, partial [Senegalimassilia sp.]|nr:NYN domain-containing protein [Senegalimassilia sp.]